MRHALLLCLALVLLAKPTLAQACGPIARADALPYGTGCPGAGATPPVLKAGLKRGLPCVLEVEITNVDWWPNVYFSGWVLVLGANQSRVPVLRPGCFLLTWPLASLGFPAATRTPHLTLPPDPALLGQTFHLQGIASYVGFYFGPDLTGGLAVTLR